jgi:hypothetical protein
LVRYAQPITGYDLLAAVKIAITSNTQMPSIKDILLKQTAEAFSGRPDMPLMAALAGITPEEASWCPDPSTPSVEQIVRHIAWAKSRFCEKGFGRPMILNDESVNDDGDSADLPQEFPCGAAWGCRVAPGIQGAVGLLEHAHRFLTECLKSF